MASSGFNPGPGGAAGLGSSPPNTSHPLPHEGNSRKLKRKGAPQGQQQQFPGGSSHQLPPHLRQRSQQQQHHQGPPPPPPNMGAPLSVGLMGWGTSYDDESTDFVMDEMDRLTPRDLSVARFRKNHELMESIFDHRKIADLQPDHSSPYANLSAATLRAQLKVSEESTLEMQSAHVERMKLIKMERRGEEELDEDEEDTPAWARGAGKGKVLNEGGYPYARAPTPEFLKKRVDEQRRVDEDERRLAEEEEQRKRQAAVVQEQQQQPPSQAPTEVKMDIEGAETTADQDADADEDADADADADADEDEDGDAEDEEENDGDAATPAVTVPTAAVHAASPETQRRADEIEAITKTNERLGVDGRGDTDMVEIIQNNDTAAPPSEQQAAITQTSTSTVEPATLATESANVTHPLSAEAQAAAIEPSGVVAAKDVEQAAQAGTASGVTAETQEQPAQAQLPEQPVEMKAPTPTLDENLGENDAPKPL